ncbi:MAG TPA: MgtC/SapB family protein [Caulobacteraceae bacterium]|jgi:putative Mg2+ transporter-C (MgtC) family protein
MDPVLARVALNLACAVVAGAAVGAERSFNGRTAGLRTHAVVALAAAGVMSLAFKSQFVPGAPLAQGVMTGVGFLGAGVIFKEGISIQGLTTAAAVWATAAIGLLMGAGLYGAGAVMTGLVLVVLIGFRAIETAMPHNVYAYATFVFERSKAPGEDELAELLGDRNVKLYDVSYAGRAVGDQFEYRGNLVTSDESCLQRVAERLKEAPGLISFDLAKLSK